MRNASNRLVVKVTCGTESLERLNQGFTVAAIAVASGVGVSLWLTGEATWMALPGRAEQVSLPQSPPLSDLRDAILAGGSMTVCGQCAARRDLREDDLVTGVAIRGSASFVEEVMARKTQALVY